MNKKCKECRRNITTESYLYVEGKQYGPLCAKCFLKHSLLDYKTPIIDSSYYRVITEDGVNKNGEK